MVASVSEHESGKTAHIPGKFTLWNKYTAKLMKSNEKRTFIFGYDIYSDIMAHIY